MTPKAMIKEHRKNYPGCPSTRAECRHWGNFSYIATFNGFPPAIGNLEAFDEQTARKLALYSLARDVPFEVLELKVTKA